MNDDPPDRLKGIAYGFIYASMMGAMVWAIENDHVEGSLILVGLAVGLFAVLYGVIRR